MNPDTGCFKKKKKELLVDHSTCTKAEDLILKMFEKLF